MKKAILVLIVLSMISCNGFMRIEKRKYTGGYKVEVIAKPVKKKTNEGEYSVLQQHNKRFAANNLLHQPSCDTITNEQRQNKNQDEIVTKNKKPNVNSFQSTVYRSVNNFAANEVKEGIPQLELNEKEDRIWKNNNRQYASEKCTNGFFLMLASIFGAFTIFPFVGFLQKPGRLAYWANSNKKKSWALIAFARVVFGAAGLYIGHKFFDFGVRISDVSTYILLALNSFIILIHPFSKIKQGFIKHTYFKQKLYALCLTILGMSMCAVVGNKSAADKKFAPIISATVNKMECGVEKIDSKFDKIMALFYSKQIPKNKTWRIVKEILMTLLAITLFIFLLVGVAGLTCNLSCTGQEVAAVVALLGGLALSIWLFIISLRAIQKWSKMKEAQEAIKS